MNTKILEIKSLFHRYSVLWAVKDVSLEITKPGVYGLLGANGAGKSTIMNIMCGILKPTRGMVNILGIDITTNPIEAKKNIGFLPQQPPVLEDLTVEEYLELAAGIRLVPEKKIHQSVEMVLERCKIKHFRNRLIKNLSGGYRQRIGIAQAIIHNPPFVVLDEPTNGLDPNQIVEIRHLIQEIAKTHTVILSTHILPEVSALCEYIWMIDQGQMIFSGSMDEFDSLVESSTVIASFSTLPPVEELKQLPGIVQVEKFEKDKIRIFYSKRQEAVESLMRYGLSSDCSIKEIYNEKVSLEEIFSSLTLKHYR